MTTLLVAMIVAASIAVVACSPSAKYRTLSFFFDGVPNPSAPQPAATAESAKGHTALTAGGPASPPPPRVYTHTPYRDNRCGGCHDFTTGQLVQSIDDGLCMTCHSKLLEGKRFVHGPVNVNACGLCHHYHASPHEHLLLTDPIETCVQCHERDSLGPGEHHASIGPDGCTPCHDPHGGDNRFFLKRSAP